MHDRGCRYRVLGQGAVDEKACEQMVQLERPRRWLFSCGPHTHIVAGRLRWERGACCVAVRTAFDSVCQSLNICRGDIYRYQRELPLLCTMTCIARPKLDPRTTNETPGIKDAVSSVYYSITVAYFASNTCRTVLLPVTGLFALLRAR